MTTKTTSKKRVATKRATTRKTTGKKRVATKRTTRKTTVKKRGASKTKVSNPPKKNSDNYRIIDVWEAPKTLIRDLGGSEKEPSGIYFETDPDFVIANGYKVPFLCVGKKIIVYDLDRETEKVIERWLNGEGKHIKNASWERFNKMKNAVAYRGNSGYTYAIYEL
jgi:hypothetical protein